MRDKVEGCRDLCDLRPQILAQESQKLASVSGETT